MVMPATATLSTEETKEAIQVSGIDELLIMTGLVCVAAIAVWELIKVLH